MVYFGTMKKPLTAAKPASKAPKSKDTIGGQPENDKDAQEAGLGSATSKKDGSKKRGKK